MWRIFGRKSAIISPPSKAVNFKRKIQEKIAAE